MPQRTLKFTIRQDGRVEECVEGVIGSSCNELTEKLEDALGVVEQREAKPEAYLNPQEQTQTLSAEIH